VTSPDRSSFSSGPKPWERRSVGRRALGGVGRVIDFRSRIALAAGGLVGITAVGVLSVEQIADDLVATPEEAQTIMLSAIVGLSVLAAVIMLVFVRLTLRPLAKMATACDAVAAGESAFGQVGFDRRRTDVLGRFARSVGTLADSVAEHEKRADDATRAAAEQTRRLQAQVADHAARFEKANAQLAGEIAEKEDFLRAVSHDLNAPLRNIAGMVAMIQRKHGDTLDADVAKRLERVQKNVEHEGELINDLLDLSRIKTQMPGQSELEVLDLEKLVWDLRGVLENDLREAAIELKLDACLPKVRCDLQRMRQVFQNLIDNAIKYMGDGSPGDDGVRRREIGVGCRRVGGEVEFWVRDTGRGIAAEDIDKVFYVFRRAKNHGDAPGKGVGLASVKSIIQTYNGTIGVESELGRGSTFRFTINAAFLAESGDDGLKPLFGQADQTVGAAA
jgi:signal transduction histidine kinase